MEQAEVGTLNAPQDTSYNCIYRQFGRSAREKIGWKKAGCESKICRIRINGNDLKGNTFRFLCTKRTEGTCIEMTSSARIAVNRHHRDRVEDKRAGQTYEIRATFPEPLS